MKEIDFHKMQGLGNDYVYLVCLDTLPDNPSDLARDISDRHFGIGGDGLVIITKSHKADFRMIMFNADGSEAQMCGNASRCIAKLMYEQGYLTGDEMTLETLAGIKRIKLDIQEGVVKSVSVNMGKPLLEAAAIPVVIRQDEMGQPPVRTAKCGDQTFEIHCVGMGNPHGVIFREMDEESFNKFGPLLEKHEIWPEKANIEFVKIVDSHNVDMRVWERGTGETLACGTGACATAVAAILTGRTLNKVNVRMRGGSLLISLDNEGNVIMTGDAEYVARGTYYWNEK